MSLCDVNTNSIDFFEQPISKALEIRFDYISVTLPFYYDEYQQNASMLFELEVLCDILGFSHQEIVQDDFAMHNYENQFRIGEKIYVRFMGERTRLKVESGEYVDSCNIELRGSALREIENRQIFNYEELFYYILNERKGRFTRLDIAIDDLKGDKITIPLILYYLKKRYYTSSFRSLYKLHGNEYDGMSIDFGTIKSSQYLIIYDKKAERKVKKDIFSGDFWTRYEMRFYNDKATQVARALLERNFDSMGTFSKRLLNDMLCLRKKNNYDRKHQYLVDPLKKWIHFLGDIEHGELDFSKTSSVTTIDKRYAWLDNSVTGAIASLIVSDCGNLDEKYCFKGIALFVHILDKAIEKFSDVKYLKRNKAIIKNYLLKNGKDITFDSNTLSSLIEEFKLLKKRLIKDYEYPF